MTNQTRTVLTEGEMELQLTESKLNIVEVLKDAATNYSEFSKKMGEGSAEAMVPTNTGESTKITLQLIGAVMLTKEMYKKTLKEDMIAEGEDYTERATVRLFLLLTSYILTEQPNWIIGGYVKGKSGGKIPITIIYSPALQKCFYCMKRKSDTLSSTNHFNPSFNFPRPSAN